MKTIIKKLLPTENWTVSIDNDYVTLLTSKDEFASIRHDKEDNNYYNVINNYAISKHKTMEDAIKELKNPSVNTIIIIINALNKISQNEKK